MIIVVALATLYGINGFGAGMMVNLAILYGIDRAVEWVEDRRYERSSWARQRRAA